MFTTSRSSSSRIAALPIVVGLAALAACAGTSTDAAEGSTDIASLDDVATLETESSTDQTGAADESNDSTLTADEAALEFSECLRDQGLDVPDIGVDADGNVEVRDAFENIDRGDDSFREALQACNEILADAGFGGGGGGLGGGRDSVEIQDAFVALTDCVREQGFEEATEITLGQPGAGQGGQAAPEGGQPGQGQNQGPGADGRTNRLATQLGLDPEDPDVAEAMEVCSPILDEAFSAAGIGQPGSN